MISFDEAYRLTIDTIQPLDSESISLLEAVGRVSSKDLWAKVDSPSVDVSLKDGYAVQSADVRDASLEQEVRLGLVGQVAAGGDWDGEVGPGQAVRILSGAPIPEGAQAVLAEEFTRQEGDNIFAFNTAEPGRNVLSRGEDVRQGQLLVEEGEILRPTKIGYLASAGYDQVPAVRRPRVAVIATGDEVVAPGEPLVEGKLYASNLVTLASWCRRYGFQVMTQVVPDVEDELYKSLGQALENFDAVLTSGGAWKGERDLVTDVLQSLGWEKIYHRVRMGPGKAVGFGLVGKRPAFCLPGGPPSNHMAFLQLALPGLLRLSGWKDPGLPTNHVELAETVRGQEDWTQFVHGQIDRDQRPIKFTPLKMKSRLQEMADSDAIVKIPEGEDRIEEGEMITGQFLL